MAIVILYLVVLGLGLWVAVKLINLHKENEELQERLTRLEVDWIKHRSAGPVSPPASPGVAGPIPKEAPSPVPPPEAGLVAPPPIPSLQPAAAEAAGGAGWRGARRCAR